MVRDIEAFEMKGNYDGFRRDKPNRFFPWNYSS